MADITSNLELHLKLDETSGTVPVDSSANALVCGLTGAGFDFTNNGVDGQFGRALNFDDPATGLDRITIPCAPGDVLDLSDNFTVAFWIYLNASVSTQVIIKRGTNSSAVGNQQWGIHIQIANQVRMYMGDGAGAGDTYQSTGTITDQTWTHVAIRVTNGLIECFFDGAKDGTSLQRVEAAWGGTEDLCQIGDYKLNKAWPLDACVDDVRIYSRVLTATEVRAVFNNPYGEGLNDDPNLLLYLKMDETSVADTDVMADSSINGFDGTIVGSGFSSIVGKFGKALQFPAAASKSLDCGTDAAFNFTDHDFSVAFWGLFPSTGSNTANYVISRYSAWNTNGWTIQWNASTNDYLRFYTFKGGGNDLSYHLINAYLDAWHHYCWTREGTKPKLYIDGNLVESLTVEDSHADPVSIASTELKIGAGSADGTFDGALDDVRVYNRVLSQEDITELQSPYFSPAQAQCGRPLRLGVGLGI